MVLDLKQMILFSDFFHSIFAHLLQVSQIPLIMKLQKQFLFTATGKNYSGTPRFEPKNQ